MEVKFTIDNATDCELLLIEAVRADVDAEYVQSLQQDPDGNGDSDAAGRWVDVLEWDAEVRTRAGLLT